MRVITSSIGFFPHTHTGKSGGQVHRFAPAAMVEPANRGLKAILEYGQLRVDFDPDGLERPLRRMSPSATSACGDCCLDHLDEFFAGLDGRLLASFHDEIRDAAGPLLIGIHTDDPSEVGCVVGVDDLCCG